MKTSYLWNKLILSVLVLVIAACAKNELPQIDEEDSDYYVMLTVNGERIEYKSGISASLSKAPDKAGDYQQFDLTVAGTGSIKGKEAVSVLGFVYDTWKTNKTYENTFETDENGDTDKQDDLTIKYLSEALASQYVFAMNDSFKTGSAKVVLKEITSTYIKGTFHGILDKALLPHLTPLGNVAALKPALVIDGEFYAPKK